MYPFNGVMLLEPVILVFFQPFCDVVKVRRDDRYSCLRHGRLRREDVLFEILADCLRSRLVRDVIFEIRYPLRPRLQFVI